MRLVLKNTSSLARNVNISGTMYTPVMAHVAGVEKHRLVSL